jgi:hypothetical protein
MAGLSSIPLNAKTARRAVASDTEMGLPRQFLDGLIVFEPRNVVDRGCRDV